MVSVRRLAEIPRVAWALLLLAALLVAIVGSALIAGSQPVRKLPTVVPPVGQVFVCPPGSTPDQPEPVDQARPPDGFVWAAFDRRAGRGVAITDAGDGVETWTFDVCSNTWTRMHPNREPPSAGPLVYDVDSDVTIEVEYAGPASVWAYDLQANTWDPTGRWAAPSGRSSASSL